MVPSALAQPRVDAGVDDPAWAVAGVISALPLALGEQAKGLSPIRTEVRALWDADYLYLRFICQDERIDAPSAEHDADHERGDAVEVLLDPVGDARQWFELQVDPRNATTDALTLLTAPPTSDEKGMLTAPVRERDLWRLTGWEFEGLRTATHIHEQDGKPVSWIADIAIPAKPCLRRLGLDHFKPMTLRVNLLRFDWLAQVQADQERILVAMDWSPAAYGNARVSPGAMGYLILDGRADAKTGRDDATK